jgi:broad specificity phosphatase PhoE
MNKTNYKKALADMKREGKIMQKERGGEFSFGEWAGESQSEVLEYVTGWSEEDFDEYQLDELYSAYLGY